MDENLKTHIILLSIKSFEHKRCITFFFESPMQNSWIVIGQEKTRIYLVESETHYNQCLTKCVMFEITFKKMHIIN